MAPIFFHKDRGRTAQRQHSTNWIIFQSGENRVDGKKDMAYGGGLWIITVYSFKRPHPIRMGHEAAAAALRGGSSHMELKWGQKCHSQELNRKFPALEILWERLGAGWLLPHPELIPCPARLEFLLLQPICRDFITVDFKWAGFLLNQSPINYLSWTLYKGPIFISFPAHVTDSLVMEIFAFRQGNDGSWVFCCP